MLVRPVTCNMLTCLNSSHMTHKAQLQQPISNGYASSEQYFDQYNVETAWGS